MTESKPRNITLIDVLLAAAYYPILIERAKQNKLITYQDLVEEGKARYPDVDVVQKAIPVSTGRRLLVVGDFTKERDLPDLAALVVNGTTLGPGPGYPGDPEVEQRRAFAYNWSNASIAFDMHIDVVKKAITPRKTISLEAAKRIMVDYIKANNIVVPKEKQRSVREYVLEALMEGLSAGEVFEQALKVTEDD